MVLINTTIGSFLLCWPRSQPVSADRRADTSETRQQFSRFMAGINLENADNC